jgi:uncharacterized protein (TIGR00725 family)
MEATSMPRKKIVAVVGPGEGASAADIALAHQLGNLIAARGWILLSVGRAIGVMDGVNRGAKAGGGLTVGIIPTTSDAVSEAVDIAIVTDMGSARNNIIVLTSDVVVSCGVGGAGTASEVALALKAKKHVVLLGESEAGQAHFKAVGRELVHTATTAMEAVQIVSALFAKGDRRMG